MPRLMVGAGISAETMYGTVLRIQAIFFKGDDMFANNPAEMTQRRISNLGLRFSEELESCRKDLDHQGFPRQYCQHAIDS